uniref:SnoaL-like domain-containing protein n=1 Tax=uncultured bacterium BAC-AB1442/1414/561 TaxID=1562172 RepID=A0A0C4S493_9BACT|nr:hypothetical protein [uncultured bacterium BAC-AB1442/1414/561]
MHTSDATAELLQVVQRWHRAVNDRDVDRLLELAGPDIEVVGPRSTSRGRQVLADWLQRAGLSYVPGRWFTDGAERVVVEEQVTWRDVATGDLVDEKVVASRFRVSAGVVTCYSRHDDLPSALDSAGLGEADQVEAPRMD